MKKALLTLLCFALVLAALLGVAALTGRLNPAEETAEAEPVQAETAPLSVEETLYLGVTNEYDEAGATSVVLSDGHIAASGYGVSTTGGVLTIGYPGTYHVTGALSDGQIVIDLGNDVERLDGAVYLILDNASVTCSDGPALYVKQADLTVVRLADGSENSLCDGASYMLDESTSVVTVEELQTGAGLYSCDNVIIEGGGALTVTGRSADGIRTKDALFVYGGDVTVMATDDGVQASDCVTIRGGTLTVDAGGDGVKTTDGYIEITGGAIALSAGGDGVAAAADVAVAGGVITVTTAGGPENYGPTALAELSAKGLKGENVTITGGVFDLTTASDGVHARQDAAITGASFTVASGDDAFSAAGALTLTDCDVTITESYEALQADVVTLSGGAFVAAASNNGVDAGTFTLNGTAYIAAPRGAKSAGTMTINGRLYLEADGTDSLLSFADVDLNGTVIAFAPTAGAGQDELLLEKGEIPGSLLYQFAAAVPAGTALTLTDESGGRVMQITLQSDVGALFIADSRLWAQTYTLTVNGTPYALAYTPDACAVYTPVTVRSRSSRSGGPGGFPGMR